MPVLNIENKFIMCSQRTKECVVELAGYLERRGGVVYLSDLFAMTLHQVCKHSAADADDLCNKDAIGDDLLATVRKLISGRAES